MNERLQELLDAVQRTASQVGGSAADAAYGMGKRAGELLSVAKLNIRIMDLKGAVSTALREVGEMIYATHTGTLTESEVLLAKLQEIFKSVMKRTEDRIDPVRSRFGNITKEPVSLEDKITSVLQYARIHRKFSFRGMLERQADKTEVVVTFLALLELMKIGKIHLTQEHLFDDMLIETLEPEGEEEDLDLSELEEDIEGYREDEEEVGGAGVAADGGTERDYE